MLSQWVVVQLPLWFAAARYGSYIGLENNGCRAADHRDKQFGIRQMMIWITLVASVLGAGRLMLGHLRDGAWPAKWTLVAAMPPLVHAAVSLPILGTVLLRQRVIAATCGALLLSIFATAIEVAVFLPGAPVTGWDLWWHFAFINFVECAMVLAVLLILRMGGFRLMSHRAVVASGAG
jgi:hypothetical protein